MQLISSSLMLGQKNVATKFLLLHTNTQPTKLIKIKTDEIKHTYDYIYLVLHLDFAMNVIIMQE